MGQAKRINVNPWCALVLGTVFSFTFSAWTCKYVGFVPRRCHFNQARPNTRSETLKSEIRARGLIFIAVMTSEVYMETRARGVWDTWGKDVPGRLVFFTGQTNETDWKDLPVIQLDVEDTAYPPQRKALTMLKYVYDHFVDDYEWFIRADDDVYMKTDRLVDYLKKLNSSEDMVIGQPGVGKTDEMGKLGLGKNDNFCLGGPGIMMTSNVLRKMGPHLLHCLNRTASFHEDVEVGRCIRRFGGVMCPWGYEMKEFFRQVYVNPLQAYHGSLDTIEMEKAINLHPVKDPAYMRRMHTRFLKSSVDRLNERALILHRTLERTRALLGQTIEENRIIRLPHHWKVREHGLTRNSSRPWELFDFSKVWALTDKPPLRYIHYGTEAAMKKTLDFSREALIRHAESSLFHAVHFDKWHTGYLRVVPTKATEYVVHMPTKYEHRDEPSKVKVTRARRSVHIRHKFGRFTYGPITTPIDTTVALNFIVPLMGRLENFKRFFKSFEKEFIIPKDPVKLLVVYFPDAASPVEQKKVFQSYAKKYPSVKMTWFDVKGPFKRAVALQMGTEFFGKQSLLYYCDVDLVFRREFADRCRANAVLGKRAYFPVMFSQFNPKVAWASKAHPGTHYHYSNGAGFWRWYSFGPVCAYAKDILDSGGLNTTLLGWGLEDVDLYEKFVRRDDIEIFRAPDLGLVHVYHPHAACDPESSEEQRTMCTAAQADLFSSAESAVDYFNVRGYLDFLSS